MPKGSPRKKKGTSEIDAGGGNEYQIAGTNIRNLPNPDLSFVGAARPDIRGVSARSYFNDDPSDPYTPPTPKTRLVVIQVPRDRVVYIPVQDKPKKGKKIGGGGSQASSAQ